MRVLRPGARGDDVEAWQTFLRGQGVATLPVDGVYGARWVQLTKAFQAANGIVSDGIVGPRTYARAQTLGFNPGFVDVSKDPLGPNWPPKPAFGPLSAEQRARMFGRFEYVPAPIATNPERVRILGTWVQDNIRQVSIPLLAKATGNPVNGRVYLHRLAVAPFQRFFAAIERAGLSDRILSFGGTFAPRFVRGSRDELSQHAYGAGMDLNVAWNRLGTTPALKGKPGSLRELVPLANAQGLYWGGHFTRPDGMHFELARLPARVAATAKRRATRPA